MIFFLFLEIFGKNSVYNLSSSYKEESASKGLSFFLGFLAWVLVFSTTDVVTYPWQVVDDEWHQLLIDDSLDLWLVSCRDVWEEPNGLFVDLLLGVVQQGGEVKQGVVVKHSLGLRKFNKLQLECAIPELTIYDKFY